MALLTTHTQAVHRVAAPGVVPTNHSKLEKLPRPVFTLKMTESQWSFTKIQWENYIKQSVVSPDVQLMQLQAACDESLRQRVFDTGMYAALDTAELFLVKMKELAVIVVHKSIHLMNLWKMQQQSDEQIRAFAARITATADMCNMLVKCPNNACGRDVVYRDHVVHQLIIHGMRDNAIRVRVLSRNTSGELTTLDKLIDYICAEEAGTAEASDLVSDAGLVGALHRKSSYNQQKQQIYKCRHCGQAKHSPTNSPEDRRKHCPAWGKTCSKCQKMNHVPKVCNSSKAASIEVTETEAFDTTAANLQSISATGFFALETGKSDTFDPTTANLQGINTDRVLLPATPSDITPILSYMRTGVGPVTTLPLPHYVHDTVSGWHPTRPKDSPTINAQFAVDKHSYAQLGLNPPKHRQAAHNPGRASNQPSVTDTGAQLTVVPHTLLDSLKVKPETIFPLETRVNGASEVPIMVDGGILLKVTAFDAISGAVRHSLQLCYVSKHVKVPYLSLSACIDLGLVPANFPAVGSCDTPGSPAHLCPVTSPVSQPCTNTGVVSSDDTPCSCPRRNLPPNTQPHLPCPPTVENLPILKQYILDRFSSSAFNVCEKQPLPLMDKSPPLRIFVDEEATPVAVHTPSQVPLHWQEDVKRGLDRDCQLGVLEKVPVNDPVTWSHRMVITPKSNGKPRRVVDFTPLNKFAPRQTHHTETPWAIVSSIPSQQVKSTVDCWHGYHSVPLHPADRHLTTFITMWGRYRYRTAPQGLISAGDGYTHRKAEIMADFKNVKNCVDDSLLYDDTIEENFYRVCAFLEQGALGGCTFNPQKFQFGEKQVNFLGFSVTDTGVKPTKDFIESIMSFPSPKSLTDIRSWYGAVNQISYSFATAPVMAPFRHLLSSKVPFQWSAELQLAFDASKQEILKQCEKGVRSFDPSLPTALATDWAKLGIGYWLTQQHCSCPGAPLPGCCPTGWQTVHCGSRFCSPAESRYHPIEGEGLASITGLEKCKFFVLGLKNLILCVDHKPLLSILGDKQNLADIPNPRIMNFKLKSMMYRFQVKHVAGKDNVTADAFSRRPDSPIALTATTKQDLDGNMSNVLPGYSDSLGPPSWVSAPSVSALLAPTTAEENDASEMDELLTALILSALTEINNTSSHLSPVTSPSQPTVLSWSRLEAACLSCEEYKLLHRTIQSGVSDNREDWDHKIVDFYIHRHSLVTVGPVVMLHDRPVIPRSLQHNVLEHLHAGHGSATSMFERASSALYWPNFRADMINFRSNCTTCTRYAPSNPAMPPTEPEHPTYPFQSICLDFFHIAPNNYLAVVDRYSNWLSVFQLPKDTSAEVVKVLREYLSIFGIPTTITSDGASVFTSKLMEDFCTRWGIVHRVATAYYPRANKRAEVAVKSAKRLIRGNLTQTGSIQTDHFMRALLAHRNTPCPVSGLSPAQVVFGRVLRDFLPLQPGKFLPRPEWRQAAQARAATYAKRHIQKAEQLSRGTKPLPPLQAGDHVAIQNQKGVNPRQWSQTGVVIEVGPHHSYNVSVDGSRTITKRNRQFLRKILPFLDTTIIPNSQTSPSVPQPNQQIPSQKNLVKPVVQHYQPVDDQNDLADSDERLDNQTTLPAPANTHVPIPVSKPTNRSLPPHLRERWIVAKPAPAPPSETGSMAQLQYNLDAMYQNFPMVPQRMVNTFPMMSQYQYNPMMTQYNPMMNQYNPMMNQYKSMMNQ